MIKGGNKKMNKKILMLHGILSICLGMLFYGCAYTRIPLYIEPDFSNRLIDTIALLPMVDARKDKSAADIDPERYVRKPIEKLLTKKGYSVVMASHLKEGADLTAEEIGEMDEKELATLGPAESGYLFLFYLEDLSTSYVILSKTSKIEASAVLVDKANGQYLWRDKCVESVGQGGLISGLLPMQGMVIEQCLSTMLSGLPKKDRGQK